MATSSLKVVQSGKTLRVGTLGGKGDKGNNAFDAQGSFAGRSAYDAENSPFKYLVNDTDPMVFYQRSGAAGNWLGPFRWSITDAQIVATPVIKNNGVVAQLIRDHLSDTIDVTDFGAIGDDTARTVAAWITPGAFARYANLAALQVDYPHVTASTNDLEWAAWQGAANAAALYNKKLTAPGKTFRFSAGALPVSIYSNADLWSSRCNFVGGAGTRGIFIGTAAAMTDPQYFARSGLVIRLGWIYNLSKTGTGWTGFDTSIGVEVGTFYESDVHFRRIQGFGVGFKAGGYSSGNVYNKYFVGHLLLNKVNFLAEPGDAGGWSNQNVVIGGRFSHDSSEGTNIAGCCHIKLRKGPAAAGVPNTWSFINNSVEGDQPEFHIDIQGAYNVFDNLRFEVTGAYGGPPKIKFYAANVGETTSNKIRMGYDSNPPIYVIEEVGGGTCTNNQVSEGKQNNTLDFSGNGYNVINRSSAGITAPHFQGFAPASGQVLGKTQSATDWVWRLYGDGFANKPAAAAFARVKIEGGLLLLGDGTANPTMFFNGTSDSIRIAGVLGPDANNTRDLGINGRAFKSLWLGTDINVAGLKVVGARQTGTPANASDLATAITLLNDIKTKLIAHGLIS